MGNIMNTDKEPQDIVDALLSKHPVEPSAGFTGRTLQRINASDGEAHLEAMLSARPVEAGEDFTRRVMAAIEAEQGGRVMGLPTWAVLLGGMAAALVAGVIAFAAMFRHGWEVGPREPVAIEQPTPVMVAVNPPPLAVEPIEIIEMAPTAAELQAWEDLLMMEAALEEVAAADTETWQTLAMLTH